MRVCKGESPVFSEVEGVGEGRNPGPARALRLSSLFLEHSGGGEVVRRRKSGERNATRRWSAALCRARAARAFSTADRRRARACICEGGGTRFLKLATLSVSVASSRSGDALLPRPALSSPAKTAPRGVGDLSWCFLSRLLGLSRGRRVCVCARSCACVRPSVRLFVLCCARVLPARRSTSTESLRWPPRSCLLRLHVPRGLLLSCSV